MNITRRNLIAGASALALPALSVGNAFAQKAEFTLKYGNNLPISHPMNTRAAEMAAKINAESKGRIAFEVYPNNQLGNDTDMLSQVRSGALDYFTLSPLILGTLVSAAQISGVGFAFKDYGQVWSAMDGELGAHVRKQIAGTGSLFAFEKIWDNGYRQITTSTKPINGPDDLKGLKIRIPPSPFWVSMFKAFESSPQTINFAEVYSALQTKVVEGQENPLTLIANSKLYEVQKNCAMTGHTWDGYWMVANKRSMDALPAPLRAIVNKHMNAAAVAQRADSEKLAVSLQADLAAKGLVFNRPDPAPFRKALQQAKFYEEWKAKFGNEAWTQLEAAVGKLV